MLPYLSGFINWILNCPKENLDVLYKGGSKITELISQDSIHINPLQVFVKDCLLPEDIKVYTRIGNDKLDKNTLFGIYNYWCKVNGVSPIGYKSFSILLLDLLKQLGWNVNKKRVAIGFIITGVSINIVWDSIVYRMQKDISSISNSDELEELDLDNINISNIKEFPNVIDNKNIQNKITEEEFGGN